MKVELVHIIGVSKNANDEEVEKSVSNIKKRYEKKNPAPKIIISHLSLANVEESGGLNKKARKAAAAIGTAINPPPVAPNAAAPNPEKVGVYIVFHGGTAEPIDFKGLAKLLLSIMKLYSAGALQKVVLMACYFAATLRIPSENLPLRTFCTTLEVEANPEERKRLPMIAAWKCDVYTGNSGARTGHTELKKDGKYTGVTDDSRNESKVIAVHSQNGYAIKDYSSAGGEWHDGAVKDKDGKVVHVHY